MVTDVTREVAEVHRAHRPSPAGATPSAASTSSGCQARRDWAMTAGSRRCCCATAGNSASKTAQSQSSSNRYAAKGYPPCGLKVISKGLVNLRAMIVCLG